MASHFMYLFLKYAPTSRHIAIWIKSLFNFLPIFVKYLKGHKWITLSLLAIMAAMCILPFIKIQYVPNKRLSIKTEDPIENAPGLLDNESSELEANVLQFTPDMLDGIEEFDVTLPVGLQELICYEDSCYMVVDAFWDWGKGPVPSRRLVTHSFDEAVITASEIKIESQNFTAENSKNWAIRKDTILGPYLKVMTTAPFITKTLTMEKQNPNVLLIGLGGSSINNFFSQLATEPNVTVVELMPAMKVIAKKWFGLRESETHRVIVGDGAKFVQERSDKEHKFDVILLDACHDSPPYKSVCPVEIFQEDEVIKHIRRNLAENGTIAINVVLMGEFNDLLQNLLQKYEKHFGSCYFAHINHQLVLTCTPKKFPRMNDAEYYRRYKENVPDDLKDMLMERVHVRQDLFEVSEHDKADKNEI